MDFALTDEQRLLQDTATSFVDKLGRSSLDVAMAYVGTVIPGLVIYRHGHPVGRDDGANRR